MSVIITGVVCLIVGASLGICIGALLAANDRQDDVYDQHAALLDIVNDLIHFGRIETTAQQRGLAQTLAKADALVAQFARMES